MGEIHQLPFVLSNLGHSCRLVLLQFTDVTGDNLQVNMCVNENRKGQRLLAHLKCFQLKQDENCSCTFYDFVLIHVDIRKSTTCVVPWLKALMLL